MELETFCGLVRFVVGMFCSSDDLLDHFVVGTFLYLESFAVGTF
jgi:hypothetical protein